MVASGRSRSPVVGSLTLFSSARYSPRSSKGRLKDSTPWRRRPNRNERRGACKPLPTRGRGGWRQRRRYLWFLGATLGRRRLGYVPDRFLLGGRSGDYHRTGDRSVLRRVDQQGGVPPRLEEAHL